MNYNQTISFLFEKLPFYQRQGKAAYKANLDNIRMLCQALGNPQDKFKAIHVAGTNGKGSVAHILASALMENGFKTGLHTSPHIHDFRERVKINGRLMEKKYVVDFVKKHQELIQLITPSFFEISVAMAFCYFADNETDIAVIEVGMGGRLDSTNIIQPVLSVITNVSLDHQQFLGTSLEAIAREKAGIIKPGTPVVIGEEHPATAPVFMKMANDLGCQIWFAGREYKASTSFKTMDGLQSFRIEDKDEAMQVETDLLAKYQKKNVITAWCALRLLKKNGVKTNIGKNIAGLRKVTANTGFTGRWTTIGYNPLTICDVAHNEDGIRNTLQEARDMAYKKMYIIVGFVEDKDPESLIPLFPAGAIYATCNMENPRGMKGTEVAAIFTRHGYKINHYPSPTEALKWAREMAGNEDIILVIGSTFLVSELLEA